MAIDSERERPEKAVAQRELLLLARQPEDHDRDDQRIVGAEQPFQHDKQSDGR